MQHLEASERPTLKQIASSPEYDAAATAVTKSYIFLFLIFCAIFSYIDNPNLGWLWFAILSVGIFASAILFAFPVILFKMLLSTKTKIDPLTFVGRAVFFLLDLGGYVSLWNSTRFLINTLSA